MDRRTLGSPLVKPEVEEVCDTCPLNDVKGDGRSLNYRSKSDNDG